MDFHIYCTLSHQRGCLGPSDCMPPQSSNVMSCEEQGSKRIKKRISVKWWYTDRKNAPLNAVSIQNKGATLSARHFSIHMYIKVISSSLFYVS